jgi:hypothetical protein
MAWKLLLGYLPTNTARRQPTMERKRAEYKDAISQHYEIDDNSRTVQEQETLRQVLVDVPRTAPEISLFRNERIKRALARLLYIWAIRHPASSYVQGINDLATPLFAVFLSDYYNGEDVLDGNVMVVISDERLEEVRTRNKTNTKRNNQHGPAKIDRGYRSGFEEGWFGSSHVFAFFCFVAKLILPFIHSFIRSIMLLGRSRCLLVFDQHFGGHSRSLYSGSTWRPTHGDAIGRIGEPHRCGVVRAFGKCGHSIYAICL